MHPVFEIMEDCGGQIIAGMLEKLRLEPDRGG